jgi:hypothetical protein
MEEDIIIFQMEDNLYILGKKTSKKIMQSKTIHIKTRVMAAIEQLYALISFLHNEI